MQKNEQHEQLNGNQQRNQKKEHTESFDPIGENIEAIAKLQKHAERKVSPQQRAIERITAFLGRPRFLFLILVSVTLWMLINVLLVKFSLPALDPPPFLWLAIFLSLGALLQTTIILITQNRESQVEKRHMQLDLQISLLLDQKMSKLIAMADKERQQNSPEEKHDPQAEAMKEATDPHEALSTLEQLLDEADEEVD